MDANVSLALAAKINRILSETSASDPDKFNAFVPPTLPLSFSYRDLVFFPDENELAKEIDVRTMSRNKLNFSLIASVIPKDSAVFSAASEENLWEVFGDILEGCITARNKLSKEEIAKLKEAHDFLEAHYADYHSYKLALLQQKEELYDARISLEMATGDEKIRLQKQWDEFKKEQLEEKVRLAENNLTVLGKKTEVENYSDIRNAIESRKGIATLREDLLSTMDLIKGDPDTETDYYPTFYSPAGIFDQASQAWGSLTLYNSEIVGLCDTAPAELKDQYAGDDSGQDIEQLSFEYTIVSAVRQWFSEPFLDSDSFKLAMPTDTPISDGKVPASGTIPAYINKMVCIRKLRYKLRKDKPKPQNLTLPIISMQPVKTLQIGQLPDSARLFRRSPRVHDHRTEPTGTGIRSARPIGRRAIEHRGTTRVRVHDHRDTAARPVLLRAAAFSQLMRQPATGQPHPQAKNTALARWKKENIAKSIRLQTPVTAADSLQANRDFIEESFDGIRVIAFECKRTGLSPNPNLALDWIV